MLNINIKFLSFLSSLIILFIFIYIFIIHATLSVKAVDVWCWSLSDCDNPKCEKDGPSIWCPDIIPGCDPFCKEIEAYCPLDSACKTLSGISVQQCAYSARFPSCNISANPSTINPGQSSTLTWSSDANSNCTASGGWSGTKSTSGSETVSPSETTTYTLTCTNSCLDGSASNSCSATVTVTPTPTLSCFLTANPSSGPAPLLLTLGKQWVLVAELINTGC